MRFYIILGKKNYAAIRYDISISRTERVRGLTNLTMKQSWNKNKITKGKTHKIQKVSLPEDFSKGEKKKGKDLKTALLDCEEKIEDIIDDIKKENLESVTESLKEELNVLFKITTSAEETDNKKLTLLQFIDQYTKYQQKKKKVKNGNVVRIGKKTIQDYERLKKVLISYNNYYRTTTNFKNVNNNFLLKFETYLGEVYKLKSGKIGYANGSIGKFTKHLKMFMNKSSHKHHDNYEFKEFEVLKESKESDWLTHIEIEELSKIQLIEKDSACRDYFLFMCHTALRVKDTLELRKNNVIEFDGVKMISYKVGKTQSKHVFEITPEVQEILDRWNGLFPNDILNRKVNDTSINRFLKKTITNKHITNHSGRRSYISGEILKGTPDDIIMRQSKHSSTSEFEKYNMNSGEQIIAAISKLNNK